VSAGAGARARGGGFAGSFAGAAAVQCRRRRPGVAPARDAQAGAGAHARGRTRGARHLVGVLRRLGGHLVHGHELERAARPAHKSVARVGLLAGARRDRGEAADVGRPKGPQPQHPPLLLAAPLWRRARAAGGLPRPVRVPGHAPARPQALLRGPGPSYRRPGPPTAQDVGPTGSWFVPSAGWPGVGRATACGARPAGHA